MDEVEEKVDNITNPVQQQPPQPQQQPVTEPVEEKNFLITVTDAESQQSIGVSGQNIMIALMKFAHKYRNECDDWFGLSIMIEEIEYID